MKKTIRKMAAAALTFCILSSPMAGLESPLVLPASAEAGQSGVVELMDTMLLLVNVDFSGNLETIRIILDSTIQQSGSSSAYYPMLQSAQAMLSAGSADAASIAALLNAARAVAGLNIPAAAETAPAVVEQTAAPAALPAATEAPVSMVEMPAATEAPVLMIETAAEETPAETLQIAPEEENFEKLPARQVTLPVYVPSKYETIAVSPSVSMEVPADWGNNASERAVTSYSPVNKSGAISPGAGTLTTTLLPNEQQDDESVFNTYEENLTHMSVNSNVVSVREKITGQTARRIRYNMSIGSNKFDCEVVCFNYEDNLYTVGLVQGQKSKFDYFSVYDYVVESLKTGDIAALLPKEADRRPEPTVPVPDIPQHTASDSFAANEDLAAFTYMVNGRKYPFPTAVGMLDPYALPVDMNAEIISDIASLDDLGNTQYYHYEDSLYREMIGVTNQNGRTSAVRDGLVTALVDTQGSDLQITLPGGVCVGASESTVWQGFYEFGIIPMDGNSRYRGNEIMYGASVTERGDGSHGYVIIRNDAPYYSALSIICKNGKITEIKLECLGASQASVVFA